MQTNKQIRQIKTDKQTKQMQTDEHTRQIQTDTTDSDRHNIYTDRQTDETVTCSYEVLYSEIYFRTCYDH